MRTSNVIGEFAAAQEALNSFQERLKKRLFDSVVVIEAVQRKERMRGNTATHFCFNWVKELRENKEIVITGQDDFPVKVGDALVHHTFVYGSNWDVAKQTRVLIRTEQEKEYRREMKKLDIRFKTAEDTLERKKAQLLAEHEKNVKKLEREHERNLQRDKWNQELWTGRLKNLAAVNQATVPAI